MTILIVDDEMHCRDLVSKFLKETVFSTATIIEAEGVSDAERQFNEHKPQIVFLDILMKDGTGFDFLEKVNYENTQVIFTSSIDKYAVDAFEINAIHYILKPVSKEAIIEAVSRCQKSKLIISPEKLKTFDSIEVITSKGREILYIDDIKFLESDGSYTKIVLDNGEKYVVSKTIGYYETKLSPLFFRVHRSYLIHLKKIQGAVVKNHTLKLSDGQVIPLSRRKRKEFLEIWAPNSI